MNPFEQWTRRHLAADPQEPASPPPFAIGERVVVSPHAMDAMFLGGHHGRVTATTFTTDENDPYGPWVITVILDGDPTPMKFHAAELTREGEHEEPSSEPVTVFVKQPEDTELPAPHEGDYEPYTGGEVSADSVASWIQRAKELRHETMPIDSPVYDDVVASAMAGDGLAAEVSAYLAQVAGDAA
jgi:hypothetical protein